MRLRGSFRWIGLALLGIVIAAVVALAASRLAGQQIGIASESVSAGDSLAPPVTKVHHHREEGGGKPVPEKTEPEAPVETTEPTEGTEAVEPEPTPGGTPSSEGDDGGAESGGGGEGRDD